MILFAIQCAPTEAHRENSDVVVIGGKTVGTMPPDKINQIEQLAKTDHIALLQKCLENYHCKYRDYTCTFTKQEIIHGETSKEQVMDVKFRDEPFSVAMAWKKNPPQGDRALFVEGLYGGLMLVRPTAAWQRMIVPSALRSPTSADVMRSTLRPISDFGFSKSLSSLLDVYRLAQKRGELTQEFGGFAEVQGRNTAVLIRLLPDSSDYPVASARTVTFIDTEYLVPIRVEGYDRNGIQNCAYTFSDIHFNVGLNDASFSPEANDLVAPK